MSRRTPLFLAAFLCALSFSGAAFADGSAADADKHFKHGVELYKENDYAGALAEFQRAYEILPSWQVLYNIGESQFQTQDYANALKTLQRYLDEGGKKVAQKRRKDVEKDIEKLKGRVGTITVTTSEPGAVITVDDITVGYSPLSEPILVSAGKRKVTATLSGRPPVTEVVQLVGGDDKALTITIPPLAPPKVELVTVTKEAPSMVWPLVAWVGTGVLLVGSVTTGVLALGASGDLKHELGAFPADPEVISKDHRRARVLGITTDVLVVTALAASGVSIWLTVKQTRAASDAKAPPPPSARLVPYPGGIGVVGSF